MSLKTIKSVKEVDPQIFDDEEVIFGDLTLRGILSNLYVKETTDMLVSMCHGVFSDTTKEVIKDKSLLKKLGFESFSSNVYYYPRYKLIVENINTLHISAITVFNVGKNFSILLKLKKD